MASSSISFSELAHHTEPNNCWILIGGKVYDVSKFLEEHPGGDDVILSATGKDATEDFEEVGHSNDAKAMMEKYCIGQIDPTTIPAKMVFNPAKQDPYNPDKLAQFYFRILQFLVPLLLLGAAGIIKLFSKPSNIK